MEDITKMKKCINGYFICLLMAIICFVLVDNMHLRFNRPVINHTDTITNVDTFTILKDTTITKTEFKPVYIDRLRVDTVYDKNGNEIELVTEHKHFKDTFACEKDSVVIQSFTTGVNIMIDSMRVELKKQDIIITKEIEITKYIEKPKTLLDHFKIAPTVTAGYDVVNKQFGVMAGVGVVYIF